jgi:His-Xaa-Ser system radical SAM maturase HxsB
MTDERLDWLIENKVQVCTSLDGPEDLHNRVRIFSGGNSHAVTVAWIAKVNERYQALGLDPILYRVEALPTITRFSLHRWKDIVDEYVKQGCRAIFLRKLDPFGFAEATRKNLGYTIDEFLVFYENALRYIIELNKQGVQVLERNAAIMLCKMIADYDPNYLDLRTPGGAAIGQLAYHPNGNVYSSDEGRMVAAMGDEAFLLGNVFEHGYRDIMGSETVRALILASTNDSQPDCVSCVYKAYCGQQPEYNYKTQGSIFGRMRDSAWCKKHKGIFDILAHWLHSASDSEREVVRLWTISRPQEHYLQDDAPSEEPHPVALRSASSDEEPRPVPLRAVDSRR